MDKNGKSEMSFGVIALNSIKNKSTSKDGSLGDLLKCVDSLASSTGSLRDYAGSSMGGNSREKLSMYLQGLLKIQDGLLEIAQEKIRETGTIPSQQIDVEKLSPSSEE